MERLLERHPLLCPDGEDAYAGYVMIGGADQAVRIVRPRGGGWANAVVHVSPALAAAIGPTERLHDRIQRSQCKVPHDPHSLDSPHSDTPLAAPPSS
eukprot:m.249440 g.249440  ORF g.249440 m.249440 type:complete len:97 (-) comp26482_c0_seq8:1654-1944(-)